jgi:hypothetical protein
MTVLALGDDTFGAGFIAFIVVVVLCIASYFLFRSMNRHLRKVPDTFTEPTPPAAEPTARHGDDGRGSA